MKNITKTPIFWTSVIIILISIPIAIYYLTFGSGGGMGLAGLIALIVAFFSFILVFVEQSLIKTYKPRLIKIWLIEVLIIIVTLVIIVISERKIIYKVDETKDWFAIVYTNEKFNEPKYIFPFNINYDIDSTQIIFINPSIYKYYLHDYVTWGGYSSGGEEIVVDGQKYRVGIFYHPRILPKDRKIDEIRNRVKNAIGKKL
jgi:hypothetical protein